MRPRPFFASIALLAITASATADVNRNAAPTRWEGLSATEWRDLLDGLEDGFSYRHGKLRVSLKGRAEESYLKLREMGPRAYPYLVALIACAELRTACVALSTLESLLDGFPFVAPKDMEFAHQRREESRKRQEALRIRDAAVRHGSTMVAAVHRIRLQAAYENWKAKAREASAKGELATAFERAIAAEAEKRHAHLKEHYESTFGARALPSQ
ncbi:MAG TPA: hypothetical protein VI643_06685 [Planctomycetota bacterium]|nr:hypothetical protein [Planctomycetota bacterium]